MSRGAEMVRDWHRRSLMHPSALEKLDEEEEQSPAAVPPTMPEGAGRSDAMAHSPARRGQTL